MNQILLFFQFQMKKKKKKKKIIKTNKDKYKETFKLSKDANKPVTVVPILDPIIIAAA